MTRVTSVLALAAICAVSALGVSCGDNASSGGKPVGEAAAARPSDGKGSGQNRIQGFGGSPGGPSAAVPVQVVEVARTTISSFIETNGTLEAENEVDIESRVAAQITELRVEEGMDVRKGDLLAQLDDREFRARAEISRANLQEAQIAFDRAESLEESQLISPEVYDQAVTRLETSRAQYESDVIQLGYTRIEAPFDGLIIGRYINLAEQVGSGTPLFRISDFKPLLCPIQVPERDLPKLQLGQRAFLTFEAWPEEKFTAKILRIRPVVDAATGTVKVTLDVDARGLLRPGMFARVFVQTDTRSDALVIPKTALSLESIGDTVYVAESGLASRRNVSLGFREGDSVEVLSGVDVGEAVIVVGQDGLSNGTPIQVLDRQSNSPLTTRTAEFDESTSSESEMGTGDDSAQAGRRRFAPEDMTPEQLERAKELMRQRGLSEEEIEMRLRRARERSGGD